MAKSKAPATDACRGPSEAERLKWETEDDVRTLIRAGEIKKDKQRLARAVKLAKSQSDALNAVKA